MLKSIIFVGKGILKKLNIQMNSYFFLILLDSSKFTVSRKYTYEGFC